MYEDQALNTLNVDKVDVWDRDTGEAEVHFAHGTKGLRAFTDEDVKPGQVQAFLDMLGHDWRKTAREHIENLGDTHDVNVSGTVLAATPVPDTGEQSVLLACDGLRLRALLPAHGLHAEVGMKLGARGRLDLTLP